jgi:hypothetical protein
MATTETKTRGPKAIAVSRLIGGKLEWTLHKSKREQLEKARDLCRELIAVGDWTDEANAATDSLEYLLTVVQDV